MEETPTQPLQQSQPPIPPASPAGGQIPPITPISPKRNIILIILILFILFIVSGVSWYFLSNNQKQIKEKPLPTPSKSALQTPTPNPTTDWKTYTDPTYHFSLQYPNFLSQGLEQTELDNSNYRLTFSENKLAGDTVEVNILKNPNKLSSLEYIKTEAFKNEDPALGWHNDQKPTKTLDLPHLDATKMDVVTGGAQGDFGPVVFIAKDSIIVELVARNIIPKDKELFDQILSTFKFTNPNPTISPCPCRLGNTSTCLPQSACI